MEQKTKIKWLMISTVIAIITIWLPSIARSMFQKGMMSEKIIVTLVMLSAPLAVFSVITAISFLIYLLANKK